MAEFIRIVNWEKYQHYKDRNPPWIKLHRDLMTSETWVSSSNDDRVLAVAIMMLAAATGNLIPANPRYIQRVAYLDKVPDFSSLVALNFIEIQSDSDVVLADASGVLADARPETETETETEKKKVTPPKGGQRYEFEGQVIRLLPKQFQAWVKAYPDIDLRASLQSRDDWLATEADQKTRDRWFMSTSNHLANLQSKASAVDRAPVWDGMP